MSATVFLKRSDLLAACQAAKAIAPTDSLAPALKDARLSFRAGGLVLFATAGAIEITRPVPADLAPEIGTIYVPIRELTSAVGKLGEDQVALKVPRGKLVLQSGRTEIRVSCAHESTMPEGMELGGATGTLTVAAADLDLAIKRTSYAICRTAGRYGLDGLHVERRGDVLRLVATDGHRLAWAELACRGTGEIPRAQLIPPALLAAVLRSADHGDVEVEFATGKIRFTRPGEVLTGLLYAGEFPDYRAVLPDGDQRHQIRVDREALAAALLRQPRGAHARWEVTPEGIRLNTQTSGIDVVEVIDEVPAEVEGGAVSFGMESGYAHDCVTSFGGEQIRFSLNSALSPILADDPTVERHQAVLMPRRLD